MSGRRYESGADPLRDLNRPFDPLDAIPDYEVFEREQLARDLDSGELDDQEEGE